jgi:hypothetical protein
MATIRTAKMFAEKLNSKLDDLDMPPNLRARIPLVAKLLRISPERVRLWLQGSQMPTEREFDLIVNELGFDPHWVKEREKTH